MLKITSIPRVVKCLTGFLCLITLFIALASCQSKPIEKKVPTQTTNPGPGSLRQVNSRGDIFNDRFESSSGAYKNIDTGMHLSLPRQWVMFAHYNNMPPQLRQAAIKMRQSDQSQGMNGEMVFAARTQNMLLWLRVITEEAHMSLEQYYQIVKLANFKDLGDATIKEPQAVSIGGWDAIRWEYSMPHRGNSVRFVEYQVKHGAFNSRITFWGLDSMMDEQRNNWEKLIQNMSFGI